MLLGILHCCRPEVIPVGTLVIIIIIKPNGTKTVKGRRFGLFQVVMDEHTQHSFLGRLPAYLNQRLPKNAANDSFLFSPITSNKQSRTAQCQPRT